jgi:hypothetical protein
MIPHRKGRHNEAKYLSADCMNKHKAAESQKMLLRHSASQMDVRSECTRNADMKTERAGGQNKKEYAQQVTYSIDQYRTNSVLYKQYRNEHQAYNLLTLKTVQYTTEIHKVIHRPLIKIK